MPWIKGTKDRAWRILDKAFPVISDALDVPVDELRAYILEGKDPGKPADAITVEDAEALAAMAGSMAARPKIDMAELSKGTADEELYHSEPSEKPIIVSEVEFAEAKANKILYNKETLAHVVGEIKRRQAENVEKAKAKRNRTGIRGAMKALVTDGTPLPVVPEPEPKLDPPPDGTSVRKIEVPLVPGKSPKYRLRDGKGHFLKRSGVGFTADIAFAWKGTKLNIEQIIDRNPDYADLTTIPLPHSEW